MRRLLPGAQAGNLLIVAAGASFTAGALLLDPGPGTFPLFAGLALMLLAGLSIITGPSRLSTPTPIDARAIGMVALGIGLFALLTPAAGVLPASFAAAFCATLAARSMSWGRRIIFSAAIVPAVWVLFILLLNLPFVAVRGL